MDKGLLSLDVVLRLPLKRIEVFQSRSVRKVAVLLLLAGSAFPWHRRRSRYWVDAKRIFHLFRRR
jgi:hypothetical protein